MNTVYVITEGDYSDYHIVAVCSTRKKAKALAAKLKRLKEIDGDHQIEEYPIDEEPRRENVWRCNLNVDTGEVSHEWKMAPLLWGDAAYKDDSGYWQYSESNRLVRQVYGESTRGPDVARKIAFDKRTQILAKREGIG